MSKFGQIISLIALITFTGISQIKVSKIERLPIETSQRWWAPVFSPDGKKIYFTNDSYNGIWEYTRASRSLQRITEDPGSGFEFSVSADGKKIAYRTSVYFEGNKGRKQDAVVIELQSGNKSILASGNDILTPRFSGNNLIHYENSETKNLNKSSSSEIDFLGIEYSKIILNVKGERKILDPLKDGSYMWFSFSPDKTKYVTYDTKIGTFIGDVQGNVISKLGRRDAPKWTRDGKWIIYMNDIDDGNNITSSDIRAISLNGKKIIQLTKTKKVIELYPSCSPIANEIVYCTQKGDIYMIKYKLQGK